MRIWDRLLLRGLRSHIPEDASVVAIERGTADAVGEMRKTTAVLTDDSLLLATSARTKTILTVVPRRDIRSVKDVEDHVVTIRFDDYAHARARVIQLDLKKYGDREGIIAKIRP
jgi:hypothetical protein